MTINSVNEVHNPYSNNHADHTSGEDEIGGHATEPQKDDNAKDAALKAGVATASEDSNEIRGGEVKTNT